MTRFLPGPVMLLLRSMGTTPGLSVLVAAVIALGAFLGTAAPGWIDHAQSASIRSSLQALPPTTRDISGTNAGVPAASDGEADPWAFPMSQLADIRARFKPALADVLDGPRILATLVQTASLADVPRPINLVEITTMPGIEDLVDIVDGTAPTGDTTNGFEVMVSVAASEALEWPVGERRTLAYHAGEQEVVVTGTFTAKDPNDHTWDSIANGLEATTQMMPDGGSLVAGTLLAASSALPAFAPYSGDDGQTRIWFPMRLEDVTLGNGADVAAAIRNATSLSAPITPASDVIANPDIALTSAAPDAIDESLRRGASLLGIIAVIAVGPVTLAFIVIALAARMIGLRRAPSIRLMQARGASFGFLSAMLAVEGLVVGIVGAVAGTLLARLWPGASGGDGLLVSAVAAVAPALLLPIAAHLAAASTARADLGQAPTASRRRRLAVELTAVAIAGILTFLLLQRGSGVSGLDPLLLVVPIAVGLVAAILALRVLPVVLALFERTGSRSAALVPLLGPARARRDAVVRAAPVLAVVLGISAAISGVAVSATTVTGVGVNARLESGADIRANTAHVNDETWETVRSLPGVEAATMLYGRMQSEIRAGGQKHRLLVFVVDVNELREVQSDAPASALPLPAELTEVTDGVVPVLASRRVSAELAGAEEITVGGTEVRLAATGPAQLPFGNADRWIMVDRAFAADLLRVDGGRKIVLIRAADSADDAKVTEVADRVATVLGPGAVVQTADAVERARLTDPVSVAMRSALVLSLGLSAMLLIVAVTITLLLGASARVHLLGILRGLGASRGTRLPLVAWEVAPALLGALPFAALAGVVSTWILSRTLDLRDAVTGADQPTLDPGWPWQAAVIGGYLLVAVVAVVVGAAAARTSAATVVRRGDEEG